VFVDTHLHLADSQFDADRETALQRAREAGVTAFVEIAESPGVWSRAVELADRHPDVYASLGIHPHYAHDVGPAQWSGLETELRRWLRHPKVVAVGEFGLDYFRMRNTAEQQAFLFRAQLTLAKEMDKPVVIHCREDTAPGAHRTASAHADVRKALFEAYPDTAPGLECPRPAGVIHCFSGTWSDAQAYMMHGFMLGIDGPVTYPNAKTLHDNVTRMPLTRLVLETDSPYLPPQSRRGERNDPTAIPVIGGAVATLKHKSADDVAQQTTKNARALFRFP